MTTVTTDIEQIKALFAEAVERTTLLVHDIDTEERMLRHGTYGLFHEAIKAVVPVLKYVDTEITTRAGTWLRGIPLSDDLVLSRVGKLRWMSGGNEFDAKDLSLEGDDDDQIAQLIQMLSVLGAKFSEALAKADERRAKIAQRSGQLAQAAKAFQA